MALWKTQIPHNNTGSRIIRMMTVAVSNGNQSNQWMLRSSGMRVYGLPWNDYMHCDITRYWFIRNNNDPTERKIFVNPTLHAHNSWEKTLRNRYRVCLQALQYFTHGCCVHLNWKYSTFMQVQHQTSTTWLHLCTCTTISNVKRWFLLDDKHKLNSTDLR